MSKKKNAAVADAAVIDAIVAQNIAETASMDDFLAGIDMSLAETPIVDKTDPTLPMGENGNSLIDGNEAPAGWSEIEGDVIDQVAASLEAQDDAIQAQATVSADQAPAVPEQRVELPLFADVLAAIPQEDKLAMVAFIAKALDAREEYEIHEKANDNILKSLRSSREKLAIGTGPAAVMIACDVDPEEFNRHRAQTNRYNVYAIDKVQHTIMTLLTGKFQNPCNTAVIKSLIRFAKAKVPFTMETAKDACSADRRVSDKTAAGLLVRHTVSQSTAPTQASSSMQALETLGICKRIGSGKAATYELIDSPQTRHLELLVMAA